MSHVTDILLCTAIEDGGKVTDDHPNVDALSAWLVEEYGEANALKKMDQLATGGKVMQCDVFGVAVNYCDIKELVRQFKLVLWEYPESAQLLVKDEDWDAFVMHSAQEEPNALP